VGDVGTTNFGNRSFAHNEETNVCFYDEALVARRRFFRSRSEQYLLTRCRAAAILQFC